MRWKKGLLVLLVGLNLGLVGSILYCSQWLPSAFGQAIPAGDNYAMVVGRIEEHMQVLYVIDTTNRRMASIGYDRNRRALVTLDGRDLSRDFRGSKRGNRATGGGAGGRVR